MSNESTLEQMHELYDETYKDSYQDTYRDAYEDAVASGEDHDEANESATIDAEYLAADEAQAAVEAAGGDVSLLSPEGAGS